MGYIHDFEVVLTDMLAELGEEKRREVLTYVKKTVIESYRNGIAAGRVAAAQRKQSYGHKGGDTPRRDTGDSQRREPPRRDAQGAAPRYRADRL